MMNCGFFLLIPAWGMSRCAQAQENAQNVAMAQKLSGVEGIDVQQPESSSAANTGLKPERSENSLGIHLIENIEKDQKAIWTSPLRIQLSDAEWLMPLGLVTAGLLATDTEFSKHLSSSPSRLKYSEDLSNYGLYFMAGLTGGLYLWGHITHDEQKRETGILAGEAAADSYVATTALQYAFGRERPLTHDYQGNFFQGGSSMPSDHAAIAWSIASVVAHEYPGPVTSVLAYGLASAVSLSRVDAKQHFPSDVLIGSAIGWFVGQHVYRAHHDTSLDGGTWETHTESSDYDENHRQRQSMGSTFVPLDSWVYATFEKLAGMGYVTSSMSGMQPWTRMECARLTEEAAERLQQDQNPHERVSDFIAGLQREFAYEENLLNGGRNLTASVESIYARVVSISGPALTDGYHFGQTVSYDFGRPFERGTNGQAGGALRAAAGPLAFYVRAEFQHAPSAPAVKRGTRNYCGARLSSGAAGGSGRSDQPARAIGSIRNAGRESVATGGRQTEFVLGAGTRRVIDMERQFSAGGMVRLVNPKPFELPSFLRFLGPARVDQFIGRLAGGGFVPRPFIYGQKISLKPWSCLELGFSRTTTIGGQGGDPLTYGNFLRSAFGIVNKKLNSVPGDSHAGVDWTYYVPRVRHYIVFYGELYADDDVTPIENPLRSAWRPGIFITRISGIQNWISTSREPPRNLRGSNRTKEI